MADSDDLSSEFDASSPVDAEAANTQITPARDPATGQFISTSPADAQSEEQSSQPAPQPETPKHSPRVVQMARDFGVTDEEIADHTPDQLEGVVRQLQKQLINQSRRPRQPQPQAPVVEDEVEPELPFDAAEFDPKLVGFMKDMAKKDREREKELNQLRERDKQREAAEHFHRLDRAFQKHADVFGTESHDDFEDPMDPKVLLRSAALAIVARDTSNRSYEAKIAFAKKLLLSAGGQASPPPKAPETIATNDILEQRKLDFAEGALASPTQRAPAAAKPGLAAAKKTFVAEARKAGLPMNGSFSDDDENFEP